MVWYFSVVDPEEGTGVRIPKCVCVRACVCVCARAYVRACVCVGGGRGCYTDLFVYTYAWISMFFSEKRIFRVYE